MHKIIAFYSIIEYFGTVGKYVALSKNNHCVTNQGHKHWGATVYGKLSFASCHDYGIYRWFIKINNMKASAYLGIQSDAAVDINTWMGYSGSPGCTICAANLNINVTGDVNYYMKYKGKLSIQTGDIVKMELCLRENHNNSYLKFWVNDKKVGEISKGIIQKNGVSYSLAISLKDHEDSFEIIDFQHNV